MSVAAANACSNCRHEPDVGPVYPCAACGFRGTTDDRWGCPNCGHDCSAMFLSCPTCHFRRGQR